MPWVGKTLIKPTRRINHILPITKNQFRLYYRKINSSFIAVCERELPSMSSPVSWTKTLHSVMNENLHDFKVLSNAYIV